MVNKPNMKLYSKPLSEYGSLQEIKTGKNTAKSECQKRNLVESCRNRQNKNFEYFPKASAKILHSENVASLKSLNND